MAYNNNFFNFNEDPYYTPTSYSDITNPAYHNFNQPSVPDWSYLNNYMPQSQYYDKTEIIITTLHRVNGDTTLPSHIINHQSNIQPIIFLVMINQ